MVPCPCVNRDFRERLFSLFLILSLGLSVVLRTSLSGLRLSSGGLDRVREGALHFLLALAVHHVPFDIVSPGAAASTALPCAKPDGVVASEFLWPPAAAVLVSAGVRLVCALLPTILTLVELVLMLPSDMIVER